jgi:type I restriction enzyme S subunit
VSKWEKVKLGDVATVVSGSTPKTNVDEYWNGKNFWVTPAELNDNTIVIQSTERRISDKAVKDTGLKPLPVGTVLLSSRAPIGKVALTGSVMFCNQGFKNLICSDRLFNKYLFWFLKEKKDYLNSLGRGATFKEISKAIVENIEISLPPFVTQKQIAKTLDTAAELLAMRKQQLAELDSLIKSVFYEMFGDPFSNEKGWDICSLEDTCEIITDGTHQTPAYCNEGYIFLSSKNVTSGEIDWQNVKFISEELHNELSKRLKPKKNDILLAKNGTTGIAAIVDKDITFDIYVSLALLRPISTINPIFLLHSINSPASKFQFDRSLKGIGVPNLHLSAIKKVKVLSPPLHLQNQFATIVAKIEEQKALVKKAIEETQTLFDSLMAEYFED